MRARHGFTLVEALVALVVFSISVAVVVPVFASFLNINNRSEIRSNAVKVAGIVLDDYRRRPILDISSGTQHVVQNLDVEVGGRTYQVTVDICPVTSVYCDAQSRHLLVGVDFNGQKRYSTESVFTELR